MPPKLTPYLPAAPATRTGILILPGGGYQTHADHEGHDYALWLNQHGIAAFVLHYPTHPQRHPAPLAHTLQALACLRDQADACGIAPRHLGIMGSSAGGHLAATAATATPEEWHDLAPGQTPFRPAFAVLCYPVLSLGPLEVSGSAKHLLGPAPDPTLLHALSAENRITPETPPCFLWHTGEDGCVPPEHSLLFVQALRTYGIPLELHLYTHGGHGLGLRTAHPWPTALLHWLRALGHLAP